MCGSFCTHSKSLRALGSIVGEGWDVLPVMSECVWDTDTRFGTSEELKKRVTELAGCEIIHTVKEAERLGPEIALEYMIIAPCTGNTLAKLAAGIADGPVTLAAKAHLRNERPIVLAVSTNDGLAGNAASLGALLNRRDYYFVPFGQDSAIKKPRSLVADFPQLPAALSAALQGQQLQPMLCGART